MTCGNLIQNKIILFSNRGYLDAYYRANLNIAFAVEASLYSIAQMQKDVPFSNNMLFTDSNDTNTVVSNTSIYHFTQNMQTATETFISEVTNIISENREARNASNYSETLNVEFFTTFETVQTKFFKNLANYISMYLFFQDQLAMPSFYPVYDVVDSNLDFSTFVLSDKDHLLKTNIRNMRVQDFRKYRKVFKTLKDQFLNSSLTNESLITGLIGNEDSFQGVVTKLKTFLRFSETMVDKLNDYIIELDTYESILRDDKFLSSLDYSHVKLESKLRAIVSNIAASDVVTSISIVEGGEDFQVGDILTIESPDTNEADSILEVTGIINGHIREVGISFSGQGFSVDDTIVDSAEGETTFDMIVNAIQNGFVSSASVQDGGSGFVIGDNLTQQSSTGDGTGIEITVTDISGELDDSPSLNFSNTGDYSLTYNGKPTDFTTTKDSVTIEGSVSNATVEITSINPESLSGFQMSENHLLNHNSTPTFDIDQSTINFSYAGTTFDSEVDQFHYRKDQFQISNNSKSDSKINDVFHIHSDNTNNLSFKVKNIFCDSNTVELEIDSTDTNKFQVLETFSPTIDSVHNISTQITQVDIDSNGINLTSDAPNYDVSYIGNSYPGLVYGSDTNNTITADITSVSFDSNNAIELEVADSNDSNFAITDSFDDITYGNSVETISIQPTTVQIPQDLLSSLIQIDTNNTDYEAQQSFSMTYGSDSNNPITVNIDEIQIAENSIQVSTADDSNLLLDQYTVHYSDTNVDIVLTPSQYKISSNSIPIEFDSNDTNFEIDQSLNFSFTNNTITTTVDQITVDPAYIETNFSFNDTNNEAYTVNQSFDISLDGNALNPSVTSVQITQNSIDANEIAFTSDSNETIGQSFDMSYGLVDTNVNNITITVDEVVVPQNTIDSSNVGFVSDSNETLGQSFVMSYGLVDTNVQNITATVTELSIPGNTIALSYDSNNFVFDSNSTPETYNLSYGLVDSNINNINVTVSKDNGVVTVSVTHDSITAVNNILTDSSGNFSLASTPTGTATLVSFTNDSITAVNDTLTESTSKFSLVSSPTGSASNLSFTNVAITAITDILTDASGKFSLTTSPVGVVLSVNFAPVHPIQLSDSTLPVTGLDAAKFDFTQETPKGYASSISNSHFDIIFNATDSTDFELISSRDPVELSSSSQIGYTVRLSPDGNTLGISEDIFKKSSNYQSGSQRGKVKVYRWDGTTWNLIDTIQQQNHNDMNDTHFGGNIEFSTNGDIMAVAATGPGTRTGMVYVYTLDETDSNNVHYTQRGSTLHDIYETDVNSISYNNGTSNSQNRNRRIGFSSDGQYLAIGSPYYDDETKGLVSNVTIYKWNTANNDWEVNQVLNASNLGERFGFGLALSQDGQKLVIMEESKLHYYQKENELFDKKWSITSDDNSDFENMVQNISLYSFDIQNECKNLIRFTPDGSKFFFGIPKREKVYIFNSVVSYDSNTTQIITGTSETYHFGFSLDGTSTKLAVGERKGGHGSVLYYEYSSENDSWVLTETYTGPGSGGTVSHFDRYGYGISLTDNVLVIGSPRKNNPSIVDIIALVDGSVFDINTILVNGRLGYNYAHNATHVSFLANVDQFYDNGNSSFSLTVKPTGTVSQHTITHNTILATDNTFVDASNNFSLSSTPTGRLLDFTQTNPDPLIALDSNGDVSNSRFQVSGTPLGTLIIDTTHNVISAVDRSLDDNGNTFIVLDGEQPGTPISFSQSHNAFTIVGSNGGHSQSNHTIVYDADSSPFQLKANHPHGVMTDFSINFHMNDFRIDVANIINDGGIYRFDTFSSEPTDSNSLIDYWQIQFIQKPNGIPTSFDTNISNINLVGPITDTDVVWYTDTNNGPSDQSKHEFILTATGSTVNASQLIEAGDGFSPLTTPLVIANTNGHTTNYPLVTSHSVVNARIADFIINEGGLDYSTNQAVIISKAGATDATLLVDSVRDGMISGITINNGGKDYTLNDTLTVESAGGGNGALIDLTNIDNGHIDTIQIIEEGSGFVAGETLSVIHSRDTNLPNQPTALIDSVSSSDNESLLSKIKDLNDALDPPAIVTIVVEPEIIPRLILSGTLIEITDYSNDQTGPFVRFKFTNTPTLSGSKSTTEDWSSLPVSNTFSMITLSSTSDWNNPILDINNLTDDTLSGLVKYQTLANNNLYAVLVYFDTIQQASESYSTFTAANLINTSINIDIQNT